ncbi:unnamed protein product [Mytilus coruscus]|uniref:C1q domain-containing protein n=1 Tax=Mytilus coruscus TaxID=42192 RepID=A0A6J8EWU3_MYTCO|nr:unnamed protein product [Mytilus coruscus]
MSTVQWYLLVILQSVCLKSATATFFVNESTHIELRKLCITLALPAKASGPDFDMFENLYNDQLFKAGNHIFDNINDNEARINTTEAECSYLDTSTVGCVYLRLYKIGQYAKYDLQRLSSVLNSEHDNNSYMYSALLLAWYLDPVLLKLNCGPVDLISKIPVAQWIYAAEFENHLLTRSNLCSWTKPFRKTVSEHLISEVSEWCLINRDDPYCQLVPFFELADSIDNLCGLVTVADWNESSLEIKAAKFSIFTLFQRAPKNMHQNSKIQKSEITKIVTEILTTFYDEFRSKQLIKTNNLLKILPKSSAVKCNFMAEYPSFDWLLCAFAKTLDQLRSFVLTYGTAVSGYTSKRKVLVTSIDYKEYIKNMRISQIKELSQEISLDLQVAAVQIKNEIQDRFQQLGTYFKSIAEFESKKLTADIDSIKSDINLYNNVHEKAKTKLKSSVGALLLAFTSAAAGDLVEAGVKLAARAAEASNPLKWIFNSGNTVDVLEATSEVAQAAAIVAKSVAKTGYLIKLQKQSADISKKINQNAPLLQTIKNIIDRVTPESISDEKFSSLQSDFFKHYENYSGKLQKYELTVLSSYWEGFIDDLCSSIEETSGVASAAFKTTIWATNACPDAKAEAIELVVSLEEIYDFQENLLEKMASLMRSLIQIQSSSLLGSGTRARFPSNLTIFEIESFAAASYISTSIVQFTNVYMLCDILEYKMGRQPNDCQGISTNVDRLLSLKDVSCNPILKYVDLPTQSNSFNETNRNWIDLSKIYKGETVQFQIPNSKWLIDRGWIPEAHKSFVIYIDGFEMYLPVRSSFSNQVEVIVTPSNTGNRLYDYKDGTEYIITPSIPMRMSYSIDKDLTCRQERIENPYRVCDTDGGNLMPQICIHTLGTDSVIDPDKIKPSIYGQLDIRVSGFEKSHLSTPSTRVPIKVGLKYCFIDPYERRKKRNTRQTVGDICCSGNSFYQNGHCQDCPPGTISMYNGLFCGKVVDVIYSEQIMQDFTYADAVAGCKNSGKKLASKDSLLLARDLGSQSCLCGWIEGGIVDSARSRTDCDIQTQCQVDEYLKYAYCDTTYDLVTLPLINNQELTTSGLSIGAILGIILSVIVVGALVVFVLYQRNNLCTVFTLKRMMKVSFVFALLSFAYATPEQSVLEYFPVFNEAKSNIDELKQLMADIKAEVADLKAENQRLREELNATRVAFYAYMSVDRGIDWFSLNKKIVYDKVNLNIGDGYDALTGVFTAPSSGTYIFNTVSVAYNKSYMTLLLKINGITADIAFPDAYDHDDRSTATTVTIVMLQKGDQVYAVNGDKKGGRMMESGDHDARKWKGFIINNNNLSDLFLSFSSSKGLLNRENEEHNM